MSEQAQKKGWKIAAMIFSFLSFLILITSLQPSLSSVNRLLKEQLSERHKHSEIQFKSKQEFSFKNSATSIIPFNDIKDLNSLEQSYLRSLKKLSEPQYDKSKKVSLSIFDFQEKKHLLIIPAGKEAYLIEIILGIYSLLIILNLGTLISLAISHKFRTHHSIAEQKQDQNEMIGPYILKGELGAGAMGKVYKASHKLMQRPVALKVLSNESSFSSDFLLFEREARMTSKLTHPNTISIYDYGKTEEGILYYAMEYLEGIDLQQIVHLTGPQCSTRVIHIALQVCGSLKEAHEVGLIHRDIKSNNIFLCVRGGIYDYVKVLDFGLVKEMNSLSNAVPSGNIVQGTPCFISPEAIQTPSKIDPRSDIYSLGITLYHLVTGKYPFKADHVQEVLEMQIDTPPTKPSELVRFQIAEDLEEIIMACLEKDPKLRPQNIEELEKRLSNCQDYNLWTEVDAYNWWGINRDFFSKDSHWIPELEQVERHSSTIVIDKAANDLVSK